MDLKRRQRYLKNRISEIEYSKEYRRHRPWLRFYTNAKQRCTNPKASAYPKYGAKGIKFFMTVNEVKRLWFRDKAIELEQPSIDRLDSTKHYTYDNCQFIELREN